jgi:hypothetical protein
VCPGKLSYAPGFVSPSPVEKPVLMRKKMETQDRAMVKGFPTRLSIIIADENIQICSNPSRERRDDKR